MSGFRLRRPWQPEDMSSTNPAHRTSTGTRWLLLGAVVLAAIVAVVLFLTLGGGGGGGGGY